MTPPAVGDRIQFEVMPGVQLDITIDATEQRADALVITRATVHEVRLTGAATSIGLPEGWTGP